MSFNSLFVNKLNVSKNNNNSEMNNNNNRFVSKSINLDLIRNEERCNNGGGA